jgi:thioesterase domain-containing protein
MARQLISLGDQIGLLGMLDTRRMAPLTILGGSEPQKNRFGRGWSYVRSHVKRVLSPTGPRYAREKLRARWLRTVYTLLDSVGWPIPHFLHNAYDINWFAAVRYEPQFFPGRVTLFQAMESPDESRRSYKHWVQLASEGVEVREISGGHEEVLVEPHVRLLAREVTDCLSKNAARQPRSK